MSRTRWMRRGAWCWGAGGLLAMSLLLPGTARSEETRFDLQQFRPHLGRFDILSIESPRVAPHLDWMVSALGNYAYRPLTIRSDSNDRQAVLEDQLGFDFGFTLGLFDVAEVSFDAPLSGRTRIAKNGEAVAAEIPGLRRSAVFTSLRLSPKLRILERRHLQLGLSAPVEYQLLDRSVGVSPNLLVEVGCSVRLAMNLGVTLQGTQEVVRPNPSSERVETGSALTYGAGLEVPVVRGSHRLDLLGTVWGSSLFSGRELSDYPLEVLGAVRWTLPGDLAISVGGGAGLVGGYGSPEFRVVGGIAFAPRRVEQQRPAVTASPSPAAPEPPPPAPEEPTPPAPEAEPLPPPAPPPQTPPPAPPKDSDDDGVPDDLDACPTEPETYNGFEDSDGCPDKAPPKQRRTGGASLVGDKIVTFGAVSFMSGRAQVLRRSYPLLDSVAEVLRSRPEMRVQIQGHTDNVGSPEKNLALSGRRAEAVKAHLQRAGIPAERMEAQGFGQTRPIASNQRAAGRALNRRVVFQIIEDVESGGRPSPPGDS